MDRTVNVDRLTNSWLSTPLSSEEPKVGTYLKQDRTFSTKFGETPIDVPQPSHQLDKLMKACVSGRKEIILEPEDCAIIDGPEEEQPVSGVNPGSSKNANANPETTHAPPRTGKVWKPDDKWIQRNAKELLPPPTESTITASAALHRELRVMMREQETALERDDSVELGWYLPPQYNEDNLYQWLMELHSFDPELPIAKDVKSKWVLRCMASNMLSDGSQRYRLGCCGDSILTKLPAHAAIFPCDPTSLPFMQEGGGHVTVGGSVCMDLLTSDGWLPSYCISAVLLQIKLAISSTKPHPGRLQNDWDRAYTPDDALSRAAGIHGWKIKNIEETRMLVTAR